MKIPKSIWILLALVVILVGARLLLLNYITRHVNNALAGVQGYTCKVDDIDLYLYRGAFQLQDVYIYKTEAQEGDIPLLYAPAIDLSIDWNALLDEAIVSKITFERARLNFIEGAKSDQYGTGVDWAAVLKELSPLKINQVDIVDGKFTYYDLNIKSRNAFTLYNWNGIIENLCHIADSTSAMPSTAHFTAASSDKGTLDVKLKFNASKAVPDLDIDLKFADMDMKMLNGFFNTYAERNIEEGELDLYTNLALLDNKVDGYIKYEATRLQVISFTDGKAASSEAWQSIGVFLAANQDKEQLAARIPLAGTIHEVQPATWSAVWQFYSKAFLKGFERKREGTIKLKTVSNEDTALTRKMEKQLKKEQRKERRRKKREARRKENDS
jgi:hypothetical protein